MMHLMEEAQAMAGRITEDRRYLHRHAETGFDLPKTLAYVEGQLREAGLTPVRCGRSGLFADVGAGDDCVLLRADMDALPMREESGEPFACEDGRMHACGHDLHTAMLLGAARLLKKRENALQGRIRLMFQGAEETLQGAADMLQSGLFDGVKPRAAFMIHVLTNVELPAGTVVVSSPGVSAPAAATFRIRVQGRACHGAMPHTGVDPVLAGAQILLALQQLQTRETSMRQMTVLTIGSFHAGDAPNVIPDAAVLEGSMRAMADDDLAFLERRTAEMSGAVAALSGASAEFTRLSHCPTLQNDAAVSAMAASALTALLGKERVLMSADLGGGASRMSGSEDFAFVSHRAPSVMVALAAGHPAQGHRHALHHPAVTFDESVLIAGAAAYAAMALSALGREAQNLS